MTEKQKELNHILKAYTVFRFGATLRKVRVKTLIWQNSVITIVTTVMLIAAAAVDKTLVLDGKNIGLFEHPAIWAFIVAQAIIPLAIFKSIEKFTNIPQWDQSFISPNFLENEFDNFMGNFKADITRKTNLGGALYALFVAIGFVSFVWNSYQNQLPFEYLGFDFWDSFNHPCGYWVTRFYKFYLWVMLFPSVAHVQVLILITVRKIVKKAALEGNLKINPYHQDNCGGASIFIDNTLKPAISILVISSALTLSVVIVHKKFDPTTLLSLALTNIVFLILYLIPAISFRNAILNEKKRQLTEIAAMQNEILLSVYQTMSESIGKVKNVDIISSLSNIAQQIRGISNWPYLSQLLKLQSLILSPSFIGVAVKLAQPAIMQLVGH